MLPKEIHKNKERFRSTYICRHTSSKAIKALKTDKEIEAFRKWYAESWDDDKAKEWKDRRRRCR